MKAEQKTRGHRFWSRFSLNGSTDFLIFPNKLTEGYFEFFKGVDFLKSLGKYRSYSCSRFWKKNNP